MKIKEEIKNFAGRVKNNQMTDYDKNFVRGFFVGLASSLASITLIEAISKN